MEYANFLNQLSCVQSNLNVKDVTYPRQVTCLDIGGIQSSFKWTAKNSRTEQAKCWHCQRGNGGWQSSDSVVLPAPQSIESESKGAGVLLLMVTRCTMSAFSLSSWVRQVH